MPLILLKTLKNTSFIIFFRKNVYCGNIQCFLFIVWWKQRNKQKIIKKLTFSVKRNFFSWNIIYSFFSEDGQRWSFLDKMLILKETLETGSFMQFWEKKMNCHEKLTYFLLFPWFSFKTCNGNEKTLKNPFS